MILCGIYNLSWNACPEFLTSKVILVILEKLLSGGIEWYIREL